MSKFNFSLGLLFNFFWMFIIFCGETRLKLVCFGMYRRMSLLVFSTHPFCHEEYASAKLTIFRERSKSFPVFFCIAFTLDLHFLFCLFPPPVSPVSVPSTGLTGGGKIAFLNGHYIAIRKTHLHFVG